MRAQIARMLMWLAIRIDGDGWGLRPEPVDFDTFSEEIQGLKRQSRLDHHEFLLLKLRVSALEKARASTPKPATNMIRVRVKP